MWIGCWSDHQSWLLEGVVGANDEGGCQRNLGAGGEVAFTRAGH